MKKTIKTLIVSILIIAPMAVLAVGPNDPQLTQRNSTNTGTVINFVSYPATSVGILSLDSSSLAPFTMTFGNGLTYDGSMKKLSADVLSVAGKIGALTLASTDLTDTTSVGTAVFQAVSQAAARSAIGAGTSNFNGQYSMLTGAPTNVSSFMNDAGYLTGANNLSDLLNASTARSNLGLAVVASSGAYSSLSGLPTLGTAAAQNATAFATSAQGVLASSAVQPGANVSTLTNDSGYLTGITSGQVTGALGFTPYNSTNPSSYITIAGARSALSLTTIGTSGAATYNATTGTINIPVITAGTGTVTSIIAGTGLSGGTIATSGTISLTNVGTAGTYSGITTDAQGRVTAGTVRSASGATHSLNTCFLVSSTRDSMVNYSVDVASTLSLVTGQVGSVFLTTYTNNICTTGATDVQSAVNGNAGSLTIGLNLTQTATANVGGYIPANTYAQLRTVNTVGSPTFTYRLGQEMLF